LEHTLRFRVLTPLYSGGLSAPTRPTLRLSHIRGMLRFWLRALAGGAYRAADSAVFGARGIPSGARISLECDRFEPSGMRSADEGLAYIGHGLQRRKAIPPETEFSLRVSFSNGVDERARRLFYAAVGGLVLLGGLGARWRRGFGALRLLSVEPTGGAADVLSGLETGTDGFIPRFRRLMDEASDAVADMEREETTPSVSLADEGAELCVFNSDYDRAERALGHIGSLLRSFRDHNRSRIARKDHDLIYGYARANKIDNVPLRAVFGMPHHYFLRDVGGGVSVSVTFEPASYSRGVTRRASPLLLSVVPLAEGRCTIACALFRGQFLPRSVPIQVSGFRQVQRKKERLPTKVLGRHPSWQAAIGLMDRLISSGEFTPVELNRRKEG